MSRQDRNNLGRRDLLRWFGLGRREATAPEGREGAEGARPPAGGPSAPPAARPGETPSVSPGFSIEEFYRRRAAAGADRAAPPRVTLRPGLDKLGVETTDIGVPELGPRSGRRGDDERGG
jgi:hypothetical protein